mgnify:CR=1 FL=1
MCYAYGSVTPDATDTGKAADGNSNDADVMKLCEGRVKREPRVTMMGVVGDANQEGHYAQFGQQHHRSADRKRRRIDRSANAIGRIHQFVFSSF